MFALVKSDNSIKLFSPYTIWEDKNGTQYSPDQLLSLTTSQKQDLGIYDVAYSARPNDIFYTVIENSPEFDQNEKVVKITYTSTPKDLEDGEPDADGVRTIGLKTLFINQARLAANAALADTDWMLVRKIERNVDVPAEVSTARAAIVTTADEKVTVISAVTTVEELIALVG